MLLENNPYPQDVRVRNEAESLVAAGHRVTVVCPRGADQPAREQIAGVQVERFRLTADRPGIAGLLLEYAVAHAQLFARGARHLMRGADVVHLHNPPDTLFPVGRLARLLGRRVVFDHHDLSPELFADKFGPSPVVRVLRWAQRAAVRAADVVIATNESQREVTAALAGSRADKVVVVRNGPRADTLVHAPGGRPGTLDDPNVLFLGTVAAQDGVGALPGLLRDLIETHGLTRARMTVVGAGPSSSELAAAFEAAGLADRVTMTGWVAHARVPQLLAEADVCVDPAACSELNHRSTMIKVGEYLAAARPIVAYELVESVRTAGRAALFAPCGDAAGFAERVARLARDAELRAELERRARERIPQLTWERQAAELVAAYARLR